MEAIKSPEPPSHPLRQWRRVNKDCENDDVENGLGMTLPFVLNRNEGKRTLRPRNIPLSEEEVKSLEEDTTLDKGFTVWRSLPMESDLDKKIKAAQSSHRSANFTKIARPEAYLPGYTARPGGPISRPRIPQPTNKPRKIAQPNSNSPHKTSKATTKTGLDLQKSPDAPPPARQASDMSSSSKNDAPVPRQPAGGVLRDSVIRQNSGT